MGSAPKSTRRNGLAAARKAAGLTQEELAARLGVERSTVYRWESGETIPLPMLRPGLARLLRLSDQQLAALLGEPIDEAHTPNRNKPILPASPISSPGSTPHTAASESLDDLATAAATTFALLVAAASSPDTTLNADAQPGAGFGLTAGELVSIPVQTPNGVIAYVTTRRIFLETLATAMPTIVLPSDSMSAPNHRSTPDYTMKATAASAISGDRKPASIPFTRSTSWATAIHDAVLDPVGAARRVEDYAEERAADPCILRSAVDRAMHLSLSSTYTALEKSLPDLIGLAEIATLRAGGDDCAAQLALSDIYAVVGWTLIKADNPAGAFIAAQRALLAAEHAGNSLRVAAATRCLAEVHMRAANFEEATRTAFLAAVHLESASTADKEEGPTAITIRGAALLSAAAASARRGDRREAHAALKAAALCADELGQDRADLATVFGPTNVAIHRVAIAVELGDAREAARHIPAVQLDRMPPALTERRARFLIDVARSYARMNDETAAIDALIQAEATAPDELRHHRLTRELIRQLLTREHRTSDLRALADRCHLLA